MREASISKSRLSGGYPMAGLSIKPSIETTRVGARVFGPGDGAGLSIILWDEFSHPRGRLATMTNTNATAATAHSAKSGDAIHHQDQSINPNSLAAVSASAAMVGNMSQRTGSLQWL